VLLVAANGFLVLVALAALAGILFAQTHRWAAPMTDRTTQARVKT
jgi:hypothetical protein